MTTSSSPPQSYFGHPDFARWAPGMKTIADALAIQRRVYGAFEMADTATDPEERRTYLTFVLISARPCRLAAPQTIGHGYSSTSRS